MICITSTTIVCFNRCAVSIGYIYYQYVLSLVYAERSAYIL